MATDTTNIQSETNSSTVAHEGDVDRTNLTQAATQVQVPQGENVVRIQVTPGETIQLPFAMDGMVARLDDGNGNLAIKVGDVTVILQGYIAAAGEADVTLLDSTGQTVDVAAVVAATDPNLDIQTAAGPGAGDQGTGPDNNGGVFSPFDPATGIGGLNGIGGLDPTALQYGLIQREPIQFLDDEEDLDTTPVVVNITQAPPVNEDDLKDTQHARDLIDRLNEQGEDDPIEELPSLQSFSQEGGEPKWVLGQPYDDGNDPFDTEDHEEGSQTDFDGDGKSEFEPIISDDGPFDDVDRDREPLSVTAVVEANFFADLPGKMVFDANGDGINDGAGDVPLIDALVEKGLTSHGHELTYALLPEIPESAPGANDGTGQMVVAYYTVINKYGCAENVVVFTIGINDDVVNAGETNLAGNAEFGVTFNLYGVVDHPEKNGSIEEGNGIEDILGIEVPFFLKDSDSPPVPSSFPEPLKFDVIDDVPFLGEVCYISLCGFDIPISITKANLTIGHDESQGTQGTWYDSDLQPHAPDWLPDQQTDDVGGGTAWYLINKADDQLDGIAGGEASGEDTDLSYQQDILSQLSSEFLHNGNFCAEALGVAKTYLEVSFGADGKAKGNDQAGDTLFQHDISTPTDGDGKYQDDAGVTDGSRPNYDSAGNPIEPKDGTDKRAFELFMKNTSVGTEGAGELTDKSATNWTISYVENGVVKTLTVYAYQLDANTIIGMASPTDFKGGEENPEESKNSLQGAAVNDYGQTGEGDGIPVFMLRLDPETGQLVFVQYHQINNPEGGNAASPDWDGSANDPIHLYDAQGNPLVFFQATDYDGDTVTSALEVSVIDDAPEICDIDYNNQGTNKDDRGYVDEDFLTAGTNGVPGNKDYDTSPDNQNNSASNGDGPGGTKVTGKIIADFGVDTPGKFTFNVNGLSVGGDPVSTNLKTADGNAIKYSLVEVPGGYQLQAKDSVDGSTVFTVFLNKDTGNFCFELLEAMGHPDSDGKSKNDATDDGTARYEDDILVQLGVRATDVDGDYKNATLEFKVDDDAPKLICPPETTSIQNGECPVCQTSETQGVNQVVDQRNDCLSEETCMVTIKPGEDYAHWLKLSVLVLDEEGLDEPNKNDDDLFQQQGLGFGVLSKEDGGDGGRYDEINYDHTANGGQGASETLIFKIGTAECPQTALSATVQLSRFFSDEGNVGNERGKWQAFKDGVLVGEGEFTADSTTGQYGLAIPTIPGGFNELRFTALAGSLNPQGNSDDSDYYVQALNLEIQPVHMLTGKFVYTFGADNGDPATDVTIAYKGAALTSGGKAVVLVSETDPETGITTIKGYKDVDGNGADDGDLPVFKLVVDPSVGDGANGVHEANYTFTQYGPLDNNPGGSNLPFEVKIVDNDGDAITTCIDICIDDSAPETDTTCATVYEKALDQAGSAKDGTDENANSEFAHGFLNFSYNGDGPGSITEFKQVSGVGGTTSATLVNGLWTIVTAYYKLTVDEITGEYHFELTQNVNHDDTADDGFNNREGINNTVNVGDILKELGFEYTVKDADGSTATGGLTVKVVDDGPILCVDLNGRGAVEIDESPDNQGDDRNNNTAPAALAALGAIIEYANDGDSIVDIDVDFGADGAKAGGGIAIEVKAAVEGIDSGVNYKDVNGNVQNVVLTTVNGIVEGRVAAGPEMGKLVFAVMVDSDGELHVAQYAPIYHANPNNPNDSTDLDVLNNDALKLVVTATDGDGDKVSQTKNIGEYIKFYDDGPSMDKSDSVTVDEDNIPGAGGNPGGTGDANPSNYIANGDLNISFGTDGPGSIEISLSSSNARLTGDGPFLQWTQVGDTLIGHTGNTADPALTVKVNNDGTYTVTLLKPLDHANGNNENDIDLSFKVKVKDNDGDSVEGTINVKIDDDAPTALSVVDYVDQNASEPANGDNHHGGEYGYLDEDFLPAGNKDANTNDNDDAIGGVKSVAILSGGAVGADGGSMTLGSVTIHGDNDSGLKRSSDGKNIILVHSDNNQTITGWVDLDNNGSISDAEKADAANKALTIKIVGNTVEFELFQALMQDNTNGSPDLNSGDNNEEGEIKFDIPVTVTDKDNDSVTTTVKFLVDDDKPQAVDDGTLIIAALGAAQAGPNLLANDLKGADQPVKVIGIKLGGEGGSYIAVGAGGTDINIKADGTAGTPAIGTLHVNQDGTWTFTQTTGSALPDLTFSYKIEDADRDSDTGSFKVNLLERNDIPEITVSHNQTSQPGYSIVDEDHLTANGNTGNQDLPAPSVGDDLGSTASSASGGYNANFFADNPGTVVINITDGTDSGLNTLDGKNVLMDVSPDGHSVVGYIEGTDPTVAANQVFTLSITNPDANADGTWNFNLLKPIAHDNGDNVEGNESISIPLLATDKNGDTATASIAIQIDDDLQNVTGETTSVQENTGGATANVMFILDVSGSMGWEKDENNDPEPGEKTRLQIAKEAIQATVQKYLDAAGDANVRFQLVTFSGGASIPHPEWMDSATFLAQLAATNIGQNSTNYDAPLVAAQDAFDNAGKIPGAANVSYFLSDGEPNEGSNADGKDENGPTGATGGDDGIGAGEEALWTTFLNNNDIVSYAVGMGPGSFVNAGANNDELDPIAHNGATGADMNAISAADMDTLTAILGGTVSLPVTGNLLANDAPGADGWATQAISKVTFNAADYLPDANGVIKIVTAAGTLTVYGKAYNGHAAGDYTFEAADVNADTPLAFTYTTVDGDGDTVTGTLNLTVEKVNEAPVANDVNASGDEDGGAIAVALSGTDGDGSVTHFKLIDLPSNGVLKVGGVDAVAGVDYVIGAAVTFTPNANYNGPASFHYTVKDNDGVYDATQATASITVNPVNDAPSAVTDSNVAANTVAENAANNTVVGLTGFATDLEGAVTYSLADNAGGRFKIDPVTGVVSVANGAAIDYETAVNHEYTITVRATDTGGLFQQANFVIAVTDVVENVAPVGKADHIYTNTNQEVTIQAAWLLANDSDADGNPLTVTDVNDNTSEFGFEDLGNLPSNFTLDIDGSSMENGEAGDYTYDLSDGKAEVTVTGGQVHYDTSGALEGDTTDDIMIGGNGDDTIDGKGGADFLIGNGGDDTLIFDAADKLVDGGSGFDRVQSTLSTFAFDSNPAGGAKFASIEMVDLGDSNHNQNRTVTINAADLLDNATTTVDVDQSGGGTTNVTIDLFVIGDNGSGAADNVTLSGGFSQVIDLDNAVGNQSTFSFDGHTFTLWNSGSKYVAIEQGLDVTTV